MAWRRFKFFSLISDCLVKSQNSKFSRISTIVLGVKQELNPVISVYNDYARYFDLDYQASAKITAILILRFHDIKTLVQQGLQ